MYLKDGIIPNIIQKRVETLQDEVMKGLHEYHLTILKRFVTKETGLEFLSFTLNPTLYTITINVYDSNRHPIYVKNNSKVVGFLDKLSEFLSIPAWKIRFEERSHHG